MRQKDENKEQAIRQKALEMIVRYGLDGLSMQKLAKAANVSPATIYLYFKNREDLILQLYITTSSAMVNATLENFDASLPFSEGLRIQWLNRAKYCMEHPIEMQFLEHIRHSHVDGKAVPMLNPAFYEAMKAFVTKAIERKELVKVPVEVYWSVAFAPLYNLVKFHATGKSMSGKPFTFTEEAMMQTLELVLKALKP